MKSLSLPFSTKLGSIYEDTSGIACYVPNIDMVYLYLVDCVDLRLVDNNLDSLKYLLRVLCSDAAIPYQLDHSQLSITAFTAWV